MRIKPRKYYDGSDDWLQKIYINIPRHRLDPDFPNPQELEAVTIFSQDDEIIFSWSTIGGQGIEVAEKMGQALLKATEIAKDAQAEIAKETR